MLRRMTERERSFWGWGWADKLPDAETRTGLGAQAAALLGVDAPATKEPPTLASIRMPDPRITPAPEVAAFCTTERKDRAMHTYGRAYRDIFRAFSGDFSVAPDVVAYPHDEVEIAAVLSWAAWDGLTVVPFGGGTSVVGGVEAPRGRGVISVDLRNLDRVLEVDPVSRSARIQAGALGPSLERQLGEHGLSLRHYPQSFEFSTLGGWIATRAGGHYATLYTHIDDLVQSIRMVTPRGVFSSRRLPASGAGPAPDRLVLGSEGILGIISEAWMRVVPRPRHRESAGVHFADLFAAAEAARAVAQAGLFPANCRVLDPHEAMMNGVVTDGSAVLLLGFESADHPVSTWAERAVAIATEAGGTSPRGIVRKDDGARGSDAVAERWRQAFFDGPYLQTTLMTTGIVADTFETACTWDRFRALHEAVTRAVSGVIQAETGKPGLVSCRFTHVYPDGPAPYYTFVCPPVPGRELAVWQAIKTAASEALLANGATITHHHAVGRTHRPWYDRERPELFASALRAAKAAMDPDGVLNPGVLLDPVVAEPPSRRPDAR